MKATISLFAVLIIHVGTVRTGSGLAAIPGKSLVGFRNFNAVAKTGRVELTWKSTERFAKIEIWRAAGEQEPPQKIAVLDEKATQFVDQNPIPDRTNTYQLMGGGRSGSIIAQSLSRSVFVVFEPQLLPVEKLQISADLDRINISWHYPSANGLAHFRIFLAKGQEIKGDGPGKTKYVEIARTEATATSYVYETKMGGWHSFFVVSVSSLGTEGPRGQQVSIFKEEGGAPIPPYALQARYNHELNLVWLEWTLPLDLRLKKLILFKNFSKKMERVTKLSSFREISISKSAQDKDVRPGVWYTYGIVARNLPGGLLSSTPESAMVYAEPIYVPLPIPPAVEKLSYKKDDDSIRVRWENDKAGDDVRYSVYMKELKEKQYTLAADKIDRRKFEFDAKKYPKGTVLYLYVVPINGDGVRGGKGETIILTIG